MLKEVFASNVAKLVAACVCPVVGVSAVALKVPPVRQALHKATEPKPKREARAKPRSPGKIAPKAKDKAVEPPPFQQVALACPPSTPFNDAPLQSASLNAPVSAARDLAVPTRGLDFAPSSCPTVRMGGGGFMATFAAVPEPATWAQMVAGFALLGGVLRAGRRRNRMTAAA